VDSDWIQPSVQVGQIGIGESSYTDRWECAIDLPSRPCFTGLSWEMLCGTRHSKRCGMRCAATRGYTNFLPLGEVPLRKLERRHRLWPEPSTHTHIFCPISTSSGLRRLAVRMHKKSGALEVKGECTYPLLLRTDLTGDGYSKRVQAPPHEQDNRCGNGSVSRQDPSYVQYST
jgi:hypothetical protein